MEHRDTLWAISDMFNEPKVVAPKVQKMNFRPRKAKPALRSGSLCTTCRTKKSVTGICFCNY